jgi:hypothetical protein
VNYPPNASDIFNLKCNTIFRNYYAYRQIRAAIRVTGKLTDTNLQTEVVKIVRFQTILVMKLKFRVSQHESY